MPCLQFTKNAASVKHNTVKHNKTRYSCISHYLSISGSIEGKAMKRPAKEEKNKQPAPAVGAQALLSASPALFPGSLSSFPYSTASRPHLRAGDSSSVTGSPCLRKLHRPSSPQGLGQPAPPSRHPGRMLAPPAGGKEQYSGSTWGLLLLPSVQAWISCRSWEWDLTKVCQWGVTRIITQGQRCD